VDSFFFSQFDGDWKARQVRGDDGELNTILSYVVDVRPKGPVPVAALEWRIREDVPTNLRAVKRAATNILQDKILTARINALNNNNNNNNNNNLKGSTTSSTDMVKTVRNYVGTAMKVKVDWMEDETMAAYLN